MEADGDAPGLRFHVSWATISPKAIKDTVEPWSFCFFWVFIFIVIPVLLFFLISRRCDVGWRDIGHLIVRVVGEIRYRSACDCQQEFVHEQAGYARKEAAAACAANLGLLAIFDFVTYR